MESLTQSCDMILVQFTLPIQDCGDDTLGPQLRYKVPLSKIVGFHQFA